MFSIETFLRPSMLKIDTYACYFIVDTDPFASGHTPLTLGSVTNPPTSTVTLPAPDDSNKQSSSRSQRGSILVAATDALHFGRGLGSAFSWRRSKPVVTSSEQRHSSLLNTSLWNGKNKSKGKGKWALQPPSSPISTTFLPDVIEISAATSKDLRSTLRTNGSDEEEAERGRLREAAAQSIGIAPLVRDSIASSSAVNSSELSVESPENQIQSDIESVQDTGKNPVSISLSIDGDSPDAQSKNDGEASSPYPTSSEILRSRRNPSISVNAISLVHGTQALSEENTAPPSEASPVGASTIFNAPAFPCVKSALSSNLQMASNVSKHYLSSSFLAFGFGRQWRSRHIVFTGPSQSSVSNYRNSSVPPAYFLHLFKSAAADERELERLQINEDSIVFVADADVAGRRSVVKVGGVDVGVQRKELNAEIDGRTIWLLHLPDLGESQKWINIIKDAIFLQR